MVKDEKLLQETLQNAEEEIQLLENKLKKLINITPQYINEIVECSLRLSIVTEKARILSWILRG